MKKAFFCIIVMLLLFSIALSESVTQQLYELNIDGESRIGKYTGNLKDGVPDGYGIFVTTNPNGFSWHYIGNWKAGLMHGEGATYWEDGSLEIGEYENGIFIFGYYNYDGADLELYSIDPADNSSTKDLQASIEDAIQYIGNKNSHVFHLLDCESVSKMKDKNKVEFFTREEAIDLGYKPCSICNP